MLSMSKMSKIDQIHLRAVMLCMSEDVKDVKDRSNTPKGCNAMYVRDVEDVKDRSNTPKGCNAMYVEDVEDGKRYIQTHFYHNFLNMVSFECNAIYVEDVEDRSNRTYRAVHAMYVGDCRRCKR